MKAICIYVDRGEEYKATAEIICNELRLLGHQAVVEELFDYLDIRWLENCFSFIRNLTKKLKRNSLLGSSSWELELLIKFAKKHCKMAFQSNLEESPADIFICTHPYASRVISELKHISDTDDLITCYYETRFFSADKISVNNSLDRYYIATQEGVDSAIALGQKNDTVSIANFINPYPFTVSEEGYNKSYKVRILYDVKDDCINVSKIIKKDVPAELVLVGCSQDKIHKYTAESSMCRNLSVDFIDNSEKEKHYNEVDIIIGCPTRKDLVTALYLNKPFLFPNAKRKISDVTDYMVKHGYGVLLTGSADKQIETISGFIKDFDRNDYAKPDFDVLSFVKQIEDLISKLSCKEVRTR